MFNIPLQCKLYTLVIVEYAGIVLLHLHVKLHYYIVPAALAARKRVLSYCVCQCHCTSMVEPEVPDMTLLYLLPHSCCIDMLVNVEQMCSSLVGCFRWFSLRRWVHIFPMHCRLLVTVVDHLIDLLGTHVEANYLLCLTFMCEYISAWAWISGFNLAMETLFFSSPSFCLLTFLSPLRT